MCLSLGPTSHYTVHEDEWYYRQMAHSVVNSDAITRSPDRGCTTRKKKTPWKNEREGGGTKDVSLQSSHHLSSHSDAAVKVFIGDKV